MRKVSKREFLAASIAAGVSLSAVRKALAQKDDAGSPTKRAASAGNQPAPLRRVKTTKLFKSPDGFPNAIAVTP